ncbi:MAG: protein kinase [Terriglobia bacterium]
MIKKLGKYTVKSELGRGAMGVVYLGEDPRLGRLVALKTMSSTIDDAELLQRFYREAQSAGKLHHPNIVTIYDIDEADGIPFIAMEFLEGETVERIIASRKELPLVKKLDIIVQVCKGLHYAHQNGIVHRDVKGGNIVVKNDGTVKLVDFGIARLVASAAMTRAGLVMGTPMYMAPEQVMGLPVDHRADLFSIGVILYEFLTYKNPFSAPDTAAILYKIVQATPPPIHDSFSDCPPGLEEAVQHALEKDREKRYQSGEDFAFDLQQIADSIRRETLEAFVDEGRQHLEQGEFELAKESLRRVLEIDSNHNIARNLLVKVKEHMLHVQNQQRIEEILPQANEFLAAENYDQAIAFLDEVLQLDPDQPSAKDLKRRASAARARRLKLVQQMESAGKLAEAGDLSGSKAQLDEVLAIDPQHTSAQALMSWVTREMGEQERQRNVRRYLATARAHSEAKDYIQALNLLEKARELDPLSIEVETLTRSVLKEREKEERRKVLEERIVQMQQALDQEQFEEALLLADQTLQEFPGDQRLSGLHAQAARLTEIQRKRRYVDDQLQAARGLFLKDQYAEAIRVLQDALEAVPEDIGLTSFLKTVEEAQERSRLESLRQQAVREINDLIRDNNFSLAIEAAQRAMARVGESQELQSLLQLAQTGQTEHQRQERVREVLSQAKAIAQEERFEDAIRFLEEAKTQDRASEIVSLLSTTRQQWRQFEQRRDDAIKRARKLLEDGEGAKALALLEASPKSYRRNEAFREVYDQSRESVRRAGLVQRAVEQVASSLRRGDLGQAEALLRDALQTYGEDPALAEVEKRLKEEQFQAAQAAWREALNKAKGAVEAKEYGRAMELLQGLPAEINQIPALSAQAQAIQARIVEAEAELERKRAQEARDRAIEEICAQAQEAVKAREFDRGAAVIEAGLQAHPREARLLKLLGTIKEAEANYRHEQKIIGAVRQAEELRQRGQLEDAYVLIEEALHSLGSDVRLRELQKKLGEQRERQEAQARKQAVSEMQKLDRTVRSVTDPAKLGGLIGQVKLLADRWPKDERIQSLAQGIAKYHKEQVKLAADAKTAADKPLHGAPERVGALVKSANEVDTTLVGTPVVRPPQADSRAARSVGAAPQVRPTPTRIPRVLLVGGALALVGVLAALSIFLKNRIPQPAPTPSTSAVEVVTVPEGARIKVDGRECVTPGCKLSLSVGSHRLEAELNGYQPVIKEFDVDPSNLQATEQIRLNLEPISIPNASSSESSSATATGPRLGTLVVSTGEAGVDVFLNDRRYGLTGKDGILRAPLEENAYTVRIQKSGFESVSPRRVQVRKASETQVSFNLTPVPQMASLLIRDATGGANVLVDGQAIGIVQPGGEFTANVSPGDHWVELTKDHFRPARVQRNFGAGKTVTIGKEISELALLPPTVAPPPKPVAPAVDPQAEEWKRISASTDPRVFEDFQRKYPSGQFAEQAAKKAEQLEWNSVQTSRDPAVLKAFVAKHPGGPFSQAAERQIEALQNSARSSEDRRRVLDALRRYSTAVERGDLNEVLAVWPGLQRKQQNTLKDSFKRFRSIKMEFRPLGEPLINGEMAKVMCQRTVASTDDQGSHTSSENVTVSLQQAAQGWVILSIE